MTNRKANECTILVVDDEVAITEALGDILELDDFKVISAISGNEAFELICSEAKIDLVITDIRMPNGNGLELLKQIREKHSKEELAVCVMSGQIDKDGLTSKEIILGHGANIFWEKPIDIDVLIDYIKEKLDISS